MFKPLAIAFLVHLILFSITWIGFPVPLPRDGVEFFYGGPFIPTETLSTVPKSTKGQEHHKAVAVKTNEAAFFNPWVRMRDLNKPKR